MTATSGPPATRSDHHGWEDCSCLQQGTVGNQLKHAKVCRAAHSSHCLAPRLQAVGLQVSPLERWWRYLWRRKGDVYHLMFDMCRFLDGRLWPEQDKTDVQLFLQLMKHVTGGASAAACCIPAPSAAPTPCSVMMRRDGTGEAAAGACCIILGSCAAGQPKGLAGGLVCICSRS